MNQTLKRQTSRFQYGSKVPAVTITVFITIQEQNRQNSCQSNNKFSEVNVKKTFTSHIVNCLSLYIFTIWKCIVYYRLWESLCYQYPPISLLKWRWMCKLTIIVGVFILHLGYLFRWTHQRSCVLFLIGPLFCVVFDILCRVN